MTTPTHDEYRDVAVRLEADYRDYRLHPRRDTYIDVPGMGIWIGRYLELRQVRAHEDAIRQVQNEIAAIEGRTLPFEPAPPPQAEIIRGRLRVDGRALVYPDDARFRWRGVTAFRLLELVAHGREAEARAFLAWARATGFNVVRVLAMAKGLFSLPPAEGRAALPRLLDLAREADMYVHLTALADTAAYGDDFSPADHVGELGAICELHDHVALFEVANEPYHGTQSGIVHDLSNLRRWAALVPASVPVALGPASSDESTEMADAPAITAHLDRGRDPWNMVRRVRELETLSGSTGRYVIDSEHIGAGEVDEPGRRLADASIHFAFGVLSRVFEVGSTFHFEDGLQARVPRPVQQAAAEAFIRGTLIAVDPAVLQFLNAGWPGSPVAKARFAEGPPVPNATVRAYSGVYGNQGVRCCWAWSETRAWSGAEAGAPAT
jgi:hypothetical protein